MIILKDKYSKILDTINQSGNTKQTPDIVLYKDIINLDIIGQLYAYIKTFKIDKEIFLTYDKELITNKNIEIKPLPSFIEMVLKKINNITGKLFNTCLINNHNKNKNLDTILSSKQLGYDFTISTLLINKNNTQSKLILLPKKQSDIQKVNIDNGTLIILREDIQKYWDIQLQTDTQNELYSITFFRIYPIEKNTPKKIKTSKQVKKLPYDLSKLYLDYKMRRGLRNKIRNGLIKAHSIPEGYQCLLKNGLDELKTHIKLDTLIGTGDWGNVYSAHLQKDTKSNRPFALKMSRITESDYNNPYTETSSSWYEIWMLKDIIRPLIISNTCPNLPLYFDTFLCNKCDLTFRKGNATHPCIITIMELSSGDLRNLFKYSYLSENELNSALFQIMAGVHAIHMSGQILNNDIKASNILYYNIKPGGYWHYRIDGVDFYVPNYGKLFVVNDYGVSTLYNPNFQLYPNKDKQTFNLGSRYAININEKFSPISASTEFRNNSLKDTFEIKWGNNIKSNGANYKLDRKTGKVINSNTILSHKQKSFLFRKGITTNPKSWNFFEHPYYIPPFEFYNDVQDVLRMFTGGKRTTQKGDHCVYPHTPPEFIKKLKPYKGLGVNAKQHEFSLETFHVLAGSFIKKFFTETCNYTLKRSGKKINYFNMDKSSLYNKL